MIGTNYPNSPEFINSTETASPMSIELINYRGKHAENYLFEIEKEMLDFGVFEYRCVYRKNNKLLGRARFQYFFQIIDIRLLETRSGVSVQRWLVGYDET